MENNAEVNLDIEEALAQVKEIYQTKLRALTERTTEYAKDLSPVLTGHNRSSITWDIENEHFRVYTQSGYGGVLELGSAKIKARPYIYPAFEKASKELKDK